MTIFAILILTTAQCRGVAPFIQRLWFQFEGYFKVQKFLRAEASPDIIPSFQNHQIQKNSNAIENTTYSMNKKSFMIIIFEETYFTVQYYLFDLIWENQ